METKSYCLPRFLGGFGMRSFDFDSHITAKGICGGDNFRGNQLSGYNYILEISRNTLLNLSMVCRFVAGALVLTGSHLFVHVLFPVIRVLRWGKNNTMDTLRRKTSTTMKIGSTLSLLGSIPIEGDQKHQHTEYGHLSPQ
ncbi:hypothetical protein P8452_46889 [Trifolium repens]|nr:hypothetical protein P8452_46889 [Trifolium repens]